MPKPKTLGEAISRGYRIKNILHGRNNKVRVDVIPLFFDSSKPSCSFWMDRSYIERTYPKDYLTKSTY